MSYDSKQRFLSLVPGGNGILYAIQADGTLVWYRHSGWATGAATWSNGNGLAIDYGWHQFTTVLGNSDGELYGVMPDGSLLWYRYILSNSNTGAGSWDPASGSQIGSGFNKFARVFGGWNGVIYCTDATGDLFWYRYSAGNGTPGWAAGSGLQIGTGWNEYPWLWADPDGVIYGAWQGGTLAWWRYIVSNQNTGAGAWANGGSAIQIGEGWGGTAQKLVVSNTTGTLYAIALDTTTAPGTDSSLLWYQLQNSEAITNSNINWANSGNGALIGSGFTQQATAALQGYPSAISTPQGGSVGIQVSTTWPNYTASIQQLAPSAGAPIQVVAPATHTGKLKSLPSGYRTAGCGWATDFTVATTTSWPSGVYSAQLLSSFGNQHDVVFVIRPKTPTNKIAVLLPTTTYHAYNTWGGHNQYTNGQSTVQRVDSLLRPSDTTKINPTGYINHTLYSDLLLLNWMTANNIAFDVYSDGDMDATGSTWLRSYKALVLGSHPEYWTQTARQNLITYLNGGGRVISTGGNNIYEQVEYSANESVVTFRTTTGERALFEDLGEFESDILGIETNAASYMDFYPYQVLTAHAFLNGTGLTVGATFGESGFNIAASGWEVDWAVTGITGQVVIAQGLNPNGGGSMCYVPMASGGGWAFTVGSIAFNGAIASDVSIQQILANVFAAAVL